MVKASIVAIHRQWFDQLQRKSTMTVMISEDGENAENASASESATRKIVAAPLATKPLALPFILNLIGPTRALAN